MYVSFSVELFCLICNENQYTDYQSLNLLLMHLVKVCMFVRICVCVCVCVCMYVMFVCMYVLYVCVCTHACIYCVSYLQTQLLILTDYYLAV